MIGQQRDRHLGLFVLIGMLFIVSNAYLLSEEEIGRLQRRDNADITNKLEFFFDDDAKGAPREEESLAPRSFPRTFQMRLSSFNTSYMLKFIKIEKTADHPKLKPDVYTIDSQTGQPYKYMNGTDGLDFELYKQENGKGIATLLRNGQFGKAPVDHITPRQPFRMLGTVYSDENSPSISLDILPIHNERARRIFKRQADIDEDDDVDHQHIHKKILSKYHMPSSFDSSYQDEEAYAIFKQEIPPLTSWEVERMKEFVERAKDSKTEQLTRKIKRALNGAPISLYVEVCVVTDLSLYNKHYQFVPYEAAYITQDLVLSYMQVYYIHFMNAINTRFANSLSSDPDLRVNIVPTNFIFLTTSGANWTNTSLVGDTAYPSYNGKPVVAAQPALDAFSSWMRSMALPSYDYAIGLTNNDIWSSLSGTPAQRSATLSFSYIGQICNKQYSFSIAEDIGGYSNINAVAQEIGKILGSYYDGDNTPLSINCQPSSNYIMTPVLGAYTSNLQNLYLFSPCSIAQFKNLLLTNLNTAVSNQASQCLTNTPTVQTIAQYTVYGLPGQALTANDQCQYRFGSEASFCTANSTIMCSALPCRINENATTCSATYGFGAADGTICGSGQICSAGKCVNSTLAPATSCPFDDDKIVNNTIISDPLPFTQMTCTEVILYLLGQNKYPFSYCNQTNFRQACCKTCRIYDKFTCVDQNALCPTYKAYCLDLVVTLNGSLVGDVCKRTCGFCTQNTLTCADQLCQNQATCVPGLQTPNKLIEFGCQCAAGYSGLFCEQMDPCDPNPCNGGQCRNFGTSGYFCTCPVGYTGQNCTTMLSSTAAITTSAGQTAASVSSTLPSNLCIPNPCQSNGLCFQLSSNTSYCSCSSGYSGILCQFTNPCSVANPCLNGGTCFPQFNSSMFYCSCTPGFTGMNCNIDLRRQCLYNNGNCINGATCFVDSVTYAARCNCPPLYTGSKCDQYLNPCFNTNGYPVCLNSGSCTIVPQSAPYYTCTCTSGYFGNNCEQTQNTTPNPLVCADVDQYICPIYAKNLYCNSPYVINGLTIAKFCPVSCNTCVKTSTAAPVTTQSATCFDSDPGCSYWSYYCSLLSSISPHPCRKTCGMC